MHYPSVNIWPPISGISFMLITVRIGLGWAWSGRGPPADAAGSDAIELPSRPMAFSSYSSDRSAAGETQRWARRVRATATDVEAEPDPARTAKPAHLGALSSEQMSGFQAVDFAVVLPPLEVAHAE